MIANAINRGNHNTTSIRAEPYHAGLKDAQRTQIQQAWSNNQIQVAVATVAFWMGIDLAHVRYVTIHWTLDIGHFPKRWKAFIKNQEELVGMDCLPTVFCIMHKTMPANFHGWYNNNQKVVKKPTTPIWWNRNLPPWNKWSSIAWNQVVDEILWFSILEGILSIAKERVIIAKILSR